MAKEIEDCNQKKKVEKENDKNICFFLHPHKFCSSKHVSSFSLAE